MKHAKRVCEIRLTPEVQRLLDRHPRVVSYSEIGGGEYAEVTYDPSLPCDDIYHREAEQLGLIDALGGSSFA